MALERTIEFEISSFHAAAFLPCHLQPPREVREREPLEARRDPVPARGDSREMYEREPPVEARRKPAAAPARSDSREVRE
jgi:hypothetical protein